MFKKTFSILLPLLILTLFSGLLAAEETVKSLQTDLNNFMNSADHRYASATAAKAQAYLGAAMLANESGKREQAAQGLNMARATLNVAIETAQNFKNHYPELMKIRRTTHEILESVGTFDPLKEPNPRRLMQDAETRFQVCTSLFENGDLNLAGQKASETARLYQLTLNAALPALIERTGITLSEAASANGKRYAPASYQAAKDELTILEQYMDGVVQIMPENPVHALQMAERALEIARQVKIWRKESGSHEGIILKSRNDRLAIARSLGMDIDYENPRTDVSGETLAREIKQLKERLQAEQEARKADLARLENEYSAKLEQGKEEQRDLFLSQQSEQMGDLKEAFRAKLERETFESNRQKQIQALFKKGEVEILVNLDGSLLIRLTGLKFASGSSKINSTSFDLLGRLKRALEIYGDRKVRIEGHTDSKGDVKVNQKISLKRAEAVRDFLIAASMDGSRLKALGYGEVRPIASNEFEKGRAMNRRIDVVIEAQHD